MNDEQRRAVQEAIEAFNMDLRELQEVEAGPEFAEFLAAQEDSDTDGIEH